MSSFSVSIENDMLKLVATIFFQIFIFHQMIALKKLWKMFFILSKKPFLFSRYSKFCIFIFTSFFPVSHCFLGWFKKILNLVSVIFHYFLEDKRISLLFRTKYIEKKFKLQLLFLPILSWTFTLTWATTGSLPS